MEKATVFAYYVCCMDGRNTKAVNAVESDHMQTGINSPIMVPQWPPPQLTTTMPTRETITTTATKTTTAMGTTGRLPPTLDDEPLLQEVRKVLLSPTDLLTFFGKFREYFIGFGLIYSSFSHDPRYHIDFGDMCAASKRHEKDTSDHVLLLGLDPNW